LHVEPFEDASEFLKFRPRHGLVLVHDEDALLLPLLDGMVLGDDWYPHIVYSEEPNWRRAIGAINKGAKTYVAFPEQVEEIPDVLAAMANEVRSSEEGVARKAKARARIAMLSCREQEVLEALVAGGTNRLIAEKMGISDRTVEVHRSNLMKKMDAKYITDVVRIAVVADLYESQSV
jgi:FixJ family two-component response regulator